MCCHTISLLLFSLNERHVEWREKIAAQWLNTRAFRHLSVIVLPSVRPRVNAGKVKRTDKVHFKTGHEDPRGGGGRGIALLFL